MLMYDKPNDLDFFKTWIFKNVLYQEDRAVAVSVCMYREWCPTLKQVIESSPLTMPL